jgi:predicted ATPase
MILEEIQIEGFRSLKSVTWKPGRLNVLIGPNGGGKSNLLRALDLLRVAATGGLKEAILRMGGMVPLLWDGEAREIRLKLTASMRQSLDFEYELTLERVGNTGGFTVAREALGRGVSAIFLKIPSENEATLSRLSAGDGGYELRQMLRSLSIHHDMRVDQDSELRGATVTRLEKQVEPDGQNLIAVLHTLYTSDSEFEEFIDSSMTTAFPDDYEKLSFPPAEDGRVQLRLKRKRRKRADSAADLSDGTLRFLLLLTILGGSHSGPLIAIDEPENGLHPRMMSIVAAVAANTAVNRQVVFTTHSPQFLDAFDNDDPLTVTVVGTNGSETVLKTLAGEELKHWIDDYSLGKFAFSGEAEIVL